MFINPEYEKKIAGYRELIQHIKRLSPRKLDGELQKDWQKKVDGLQDHIEKYERQPKRY
jgi:hypothetical protein